MKRIENRRARFEYEIVESFTAGLVLLGWEVKSLRLGNANLRSAWVSVTEGLAQIMNMQIAPYRFANMTNTDQERTRGLLLKKREIERIEQLLHERGRTAVVLAVFAEGNKIKAQIAVVRGKKVHEKRQVIKNRQAERDARAAIKNY